MPHLLALIIGILAIIIAWVIVSIPVWISSKMVGARDSSFGKAMLVTLLIFIIFILLNVIFSLIPIGHILAFLISLLIILGLFKASYGISWLQSIGMAILTVIATVVILVILAAIIGITIPIFHIPPVVVIKR
ncbi:MAG: hypothetical protein OWQ54_04665 [Sulfolobaceae archaeon]|nr:hypothetical protein [Sulfolobaceae archaeon]